MTTTKLIRLAQKRMAGLSARLGIITACLLISWRLGAVRADEADGQPRRVVMLAASDMKDESEDVVRAVESQLSDLSVQFEVQWIEPGIESLPEKIKEAEAASERTDAVMIFWCDLSLPEDVYLFFSEHDQRRILIRRLDRKEVEAKFESLALIVRSVVEAVLQGGKIGVELSKTEEPASRPPPLWKDKGPQPEEPRQEEKKLDFGLQLAYRIGAHSEPQPVVHGFYLGFFAGITPGIYVFGGYVFSPPVTVASPIVAFDIQSHPMTLGLGYDWIFNRVRIGPAVSGTSDYTTQKTTRVTGAVAKDNDFLFVSASPMANVRVNLIEHLSLYFKIGIKFDLTSTKYKESESPDARVLCAPWRVTPWGEAGLAFFI